MPPLFIDFQNLAGAYTLAPQLEGFQLAGIRRVNDFGLQNVLNNRSFFPGKWSFQVNRDVKLLAPIHGASLITSTPPCSGFSLMNTSKSAKARGPASDINECMWNIMQYASSCIGSDGRVGPEIISFESVQGAYTLGRSLMRDLRQYLVENTGEMYTLTHMLMSGASIGAAQIRRRYFFVAHRVPFGIESPRIDRVRTYYDAICDLTGLEMRSGPQIIKGPSSDFSRALRAPNNEVDGHWRLVNPYVKRMEDLAPHWRQGEGHRRAAKAYFAAEGRLPESWGDFPIAKIDEGFNGTYRILPYTPGHVITGAGGTGFLHYSEDRILTVRECARLMGFPDAWQWGLTSPAQAYMWVGKQIPVQSGRWMSKWFMRAIEGRPGAWQGDLIGDHEYVIDVTNDYRLVYDERGRSHRPSASRGLEEAVARRPA